MDRRSSSGWGHITLAAFLGVIGGAVAVTIATDVIPKVMSRLMSGMMQNMMGRMREEGVDPAEMCQRMMGFAEAEADPTNGGEAPET